MNKVDESLSGVNVFLSTWSDKITPNFILIITTVNGFTLGLLTTGYLGTNSMGVFTFPFWLFIWQFLVTCLLSSRYVNLTTEFLNKFFLVAVIGFSVQWQVFGLYVQAYEPLIKTIEPLVNAGFATFLLGYAGVMLTKYCFSDNELKVEKSSGITAND